MFFFFFIIIYEPDIRFDCYAIAAADMKLIFIDSLCFVYYRYLYDKFIVT